MNTSQAIRALEDWSPFGLCDGTLVKQNGKKSRTVGCAQGALAFGFLETPEGKAWLKKNATVKPDGWTSRLARNAQERAQYVRRALHDSKSLAGTFADAVAAHYGMTRTQLDNIPTLNDELGCGFVRDVFHRHSGRFPWRFMYAVSKLRNRYEKGGGTACVLAK